MGLTSILFPGQGSQTPGMRDAVAEARPDRLTGAFHSPMMAQAVAPFAAALERVEVVPPHEVTVFSAVTGEPFEDVDLVKRTLRDVELARA